MKVVRNNLIPFPGYKAINIFGILFVRRDVNIDVFTLNHEAIHSKQIVELMVLFAIILLIIDWRLVVFSPFAFYVWYVIEWSVNLVRFKDFHSAYRSIGFEREAYENQGNLDYCASRNFFNFLKYVG